MRGDSATWDETGDVGLWVTLGILSLLGTSTDVSRYAGEFEHVFEASTAGVTLQAPQLDINTVAAGGGSRLFFRSVPVSSVRTCRLFHPPHL